MFLQVKIIAGQVERRVYYMCEIDGCHPGFAFSAEFEHVFDDVCGLEFRPSNPFYIFQDFPFIQIALKIVQVNAVCFGCLNIR